MDSVFGIIASVTSAILIALILGLLRFSLQLRDLVRNEANPNGGISSKDYMRKTTEAVEALESQIIAQRLVQQTQIQLFENIRDEMRTHNDLTNRMLSEMMREKRN